MNKVSKFAYFFLFFLNAVLLTLLVLLNTTMKGYSYVFSWDLVKVDELFISIDLVFDYYSFLFLFMVTLISSLVFLYAYYYLGEELDFEKFIFMLFMFAFSMCLLSMSSSLLWMMIGWDGLGITSFCLIMYYYNNNALNSAMVTLMINRFGDFMFVVAIWISVGYGFANYSLKHFSEYLVFSLIISVVLMTKSCQLPFSAWLPLAMAAPTPVSALVHSSTLVTAGIYLLIRFYPVMSDMTLSLMYLISASTMMLAGSSAIQEYDLKKVIALSTLSHISFMIWSISLGILGPAFLHLVTHAIFKSMLFMGGGVLIHFGSNNQDIRRLGGLYFFSKKCWLMILVSIFSMVGLPFFVGFYSKDMILLNAFSNSFSVLNFLILFVSILLTSAYSARLVAYLCKTPSVKNSAIMKGGLNNPISAATLLAGPLGATVVWLVLDKSLWMDLSVYNTVSKMILILALTSGWYLGITWSMSKGITPFLSSMWSLSQATLVFNYLYYKYAQKSYLWDKGWLDEMSLNLTSLGKEATSKFQEKLNLNWKVPVLCIMMVIFTMKLILAV